MKGNNNYCQVCGKWLGVDDYDGICTKCNDEICEHCGGEGEVDSGGWTPWGWPVNAKCPHCDGTGKQPTTSSEREGKVSIVFGSPEAKVILEQDKEQKILETLALEDIGELRDRLESAEYWIEDYKQVLAELEVEAKRLRRVLQAKGETP